ncbi:MAG: hypothetical protein ACLSUT_03795 [Christensenellales bacterium]|jgi:hypothetical protein|nr:MAG TPA: hypothetical protein [Caudoviricetes sp.]
MSYQETKYDRMDNTNTSYEDFKKACYALAQQEPDVDYALEGLEDEAELRCLYNHKTSVASVVYLMCM